jgi:hypothetical protein
MSKLTTYQRLKRDNQELQRRLIVLATKPDSEEGITIKQSAILISKIEDAFMSGFDSGSKSTNGLIGNIQYQISSNEEI